MEGFCSCARNDLVTLSMSEGVTKPASHLMPLKKHLFLWEIDPRSGTFWAAAEENAVAMSQLPRLKRFEEIFRDASLSSESYRTRANEWSFEFGTRCVLRQGCGNGCCVIRSEQYPDSRFESAAHCRDRNSQIFVDCFANDTYLQDIRFAEHLSLFPQCTLQRVGTHSAADESAYELQTQPVSFCASMTADAVENRWEWFCRRQKEYCQGEI